MANEKDPEHGTMGWRVDQMRKELKSSRKDLAPLLAQVAGDLGIDEGWTWTPGRVTNVILGNKPVSLGEATSIVVLAHRRGLKRYTWNYIVFGTEHMPAPRRTVRERNEFVLAKK